MVSEENLSVIYGIIRFFLKYAFFLGLYGFKGRLWGKTYDFKNFIHENRHFTYDWRFIKKIMMII